MICSNCGRELENGEVCGCGGNQDNQVNCENIDKQNNPNNAECVNDVKNVDICDDNKSIAHSNIFAKVGIVCGIIGFILYNLLLIGFAFGIVLSALGFGFSIAGLVVSSKTNGAGKGFAIAGLIISFLPSFLITVVLATCAGLFGASLYSSWF